MSGILEKNRYATYKSYQNVKSAVLDLKVTEWAGSVRNQIVHHLGEIPAPGPERHSYFIRLRSLVDDPVLSALAIKAVKSKVHGLNSIAACVMNGTLAKVRNMMSLLLETLDGEIRRYH